MVIQENKFKYFIIHIIIFIFLFNMLARNERSLMELCENEEWNEIEITINEKINTWNYKELDFGGNSPFLVCAKKRGLSLLKLFQHHVPSLFNVKEVNYNYQTMLLVACAAGDYELVKWLLKQGSSLAEKDCFEQTPILYACLSGNIQLIEYLISKGCSLNDKNQFGYTCSSMAAIQGNIELLNWLKNRGESLQERDYQGNSVILLAANRGHLECVKWLFNIGFSLNDVNGMEESCITFAASIGHLEMIKWLVEQGCSLQSLNGAGTCIIIAARGKFVDCVVWMLNNGSSLDENIMRSRRGDICLTNSCEEFLKENGLYEEVKKAFITKSSRK